MIQITKAPIQVTTYFRKSPFVGLRITAQGYCEALTKGNGNRKGINLNSAAVAPRSSLHDGHNSGKSMQKTFGPQCWKQIIPGSENGGGELCRLALWLSLSIIVCLATSKTGEGGKTRLKHLFNFSCYAQPPVSAQCTRNVQVKCQMNWPLVDEWWGSETKQEDKKSAPINSQASHFTANATVLKAL